MRKRLLLVALTISLVLPVTSSAQIQPITNTEFYDMLFSLSGYTSVKQLVDNHILSEAEVRICDSDYPWAAIVQRVLPPLLGVYPYPHEFYKNHPTFNVGDGSYEDAAVMLWAMGWEPRSTPYTPDEVGSLIEFLMAHEVEPPFKSQFDVDITAVSYMARNALMLAWQKIPQKHKDFLADNGWTFEYHAGDVGGGTDGRTGLCNYGTKTIHLYYCSEDAVYHEVGHALTYLADLREAGEILYLLEGARSQKFMRAYANYNADEYIACCFEAYMLQPKLLKKWCPLTYNYIDTVYYKSDTAIDWDEAYRIRHSTFATFVKEVLFP